MPFPLTQDESVQAVSELSSRDADDSDGDVVGVGPSLAHIDKRPKKHQVLPLLPSPCGRKSPQHQHPPQFNSQHHRHSAPSTVIQGHGISVVPRPNIEPRAGREGSVGRMGSVGRSGSIGRDSTGSSRGGSLKGVRATTARQLEPRGSVIVLTNTHDPRTIFWLKWVQYRHLKLRFLSRLFPVLDPRSSGKLLWDSLIMVVVLYSAILVPVEVGFPEVEFDDGWQYLNIVVDVLFFLDVIQNFFVGFYLNDDDGLITDRAVIAKRYLTSWFLVDLLAILPTEYMVGHSERNAREGKSVLSLKLTRMVRLVRVTKLARLIKLRQFAMKIEDVLELDVVVARMTLVIFEVMLVSHLLSCFWHFGSTARFSYHGLPDRQRALPCVH